MGSGPPYPVSSRRPGCVPLARHNRVRRRSAETCPSPFSRQPRSSDLFRRSSTSRCDQYPILAGRAGGSDGNSLSAASARWRSRRNSFMRARIIPKSSAARGWIIGSSRSPDLVLTAARSRLRADCKAQRSSVNFPRQVLPWAQRHSLLSYPGFEDEYDHHPALAPILVRPSSDVPISRNRWFESGSLQQRVHVSRDFALPRREAGFFARVCGPGRCSAVSRDGYRAVHGADRREYLCRAKFQYRGVDEAVA